MSDPIEALRLKKEQLRQQLEDVERDERELARLTAKYGFKLVEAGSHPPAPAPRKSDRPTPDQQLQQHASSKRAQIIQAVVEHLRHTRRRAKTPDLIAMLRERGIDFPANFVASYLSGSKLFDNDRRADGGYGLVEWKTKETQEHLNGQLPLRS
jgi:hypothetical protein